jgi:copper chaperone
MALKLSIPTLNDPKVAKEIKDVILTSEPDARVDFDMESKTVIPILYEVAYNERKVIE